MILYWYLCNSLYHVLMRKYLHFCNDLVCIKDAKEMTSCAVVRVSEQSCFNSVPDLLFLHKFLIQLLLVVLKENWMFDHWKDLECYQHYHITLTTVQLVKSWHPFFGRLAYKSTFVWEEEVLCLCFLDFQLYSWGFQPII